MGKKYVAYVGTYTHGTSKGIQVYDVNLEEGTLTERSEVEVSNASYTAVSKNGKYLYSIEDEGVAVFKRDHNGDLARINSVDIDGMRGCFLATDVDGKYLYVAGYHDGKVTVVHTHKDGRLGSVMDGVFHTGLGSVAERNFRPHVNCVRPTPDNKYLCAVDNGIDQIKVYRINKRTDKLELVDIVRCPRESGPRIIRFSADGRFAYVLFELSNEIKVYSYDGSGDVPEFELLQSISILEPVEYAKRDGTTGISYNVKKVFDVAQTNGKRPPAPTVNRDPKALITTMLDSSPVNVEATNELPYPNMAAFYNNEEQTLYVKRDVGDSVAVAQCVAQELGHAQLSINSDSYSRSDMGFQAVCIGYMLCKKYGIDTQNFAINRIPDKLANKEPKDIRFELSKTRNAMADIHSRVSDELYKKKQERSKDYER